jgi:hypothetical protein
MTKDELKRYVSSRLNTVNEQLDDYGDYDTLVQNAADGGNHDDTFRVGEDYGWMLGQKRELEMLLVILEETPDVDNATN